MPVARLGALLRRAGVSDFGRGVALGLMLAALAVGYMAAGRLAHDPEKLVGAVIGAGVPLDPRVAHTSPGVRRNLMCAALATVMEARGEPDAGQLAVAWVIRTRAEERDEDACSVILAPHQFSWSAYQLRRIVSIAVSNGETLLEAQGYAWDALVEGVPDPSGGANHFWSPAGMFRGREPQWARRAAPGSRVKIGGHVFIRIPYRRAPWAFGERRYAAP